MRKKVGIIGGGPSGLMAAIEASKYNDVIVFEANETCGKKLLITGNGRCNLTNNKNVKEFLQACNKNSKFLYNALNQFGPKEIINFFESSGVKLKEEKDNRMFPESNRSSDILKALLANCDQVKFLYNHQVTKLIVKEDKVVGLEANDKFFELDAIIIATGGKSYSTTGSTGAGYQFLKACGHQISDLRPCEVALKSDNPAITSKKLMGLSLSNKVVEVVYDNKVIAKDKGDLMFTHFGLSGPIVLKLSEKALENKGSYLRINHQLGDFLGFDQVKKQLNVPKRYWEYLIADLEIKPIEQISKKERNLLKDYFNYQSFKITNALSLEKAVVTNGGVIINQFDRKSLESKLVENLYVCGELLDVHGSVGGYNLTLAFASGFLAGSSI